MDEEDEKARVEFEKEVLGYKAKIDQEKEWKREIFEEEIAILVANQKKINKETARLWKNRRNKRDFLLHKNLMKKEEKITDEIYFLEIGLKKGTKNVYRSTPDNCYWVNKPFKGCVKHHVDKNTIVCIPLNLHLTVRHNLKTGKGMKEINENVFRWIRQKNNNSSL